MDCKSQPFAELAVAKGFGRKAYYSVSQVAEITGWSISAINRACATGKLKSVLPNGISQGKRIASEWVDEWLGVEVG